MLGNKLAARAAVVFALATMAWSGAGCSSNRTAPAPPDMARAPTDHPELWPIASSGGMVQPAQEIYIVVWQGDEQLGAGLADFAAWLVQSDYWTQSLGEYGVGAGTGKGLIVLPSPPPTALTDDDFRMTVKSLIESGQVQANDNSLVVFAPNPVSTVKSPEGTGCDTFAGYHDHAASTAGATAYAVVLRCAGEAGTGLDQASFVLSHEAAEAATDPVPPTGYVAASPSPLAYEIADLCNFNSGISIDVPADATHAARRYWVQRLYSGKRAAQGNVDPCVPLPWDRPYWNVALDPGVIQWSTLQPDTIDARLDVFAYGDVGEIKWFAASADGHAQVDPAFGTAHAGDTIPVTITLDASAAAGIHEIDVLSESEKAGAAMWFSYVKVR